VKTEAYLFGGVALFFGGETIGYAWWSGADPAGTAALTVSFLMAALVAFFFAVQYRRKGLRPEDRKDGEVRERAGRLDFFPPRSAWPPLAAAGATLTAVGVVFGLWLFLIGLGVLAAGVFGFVFQYADRGA
jgi:hypothetical protein